MEAIKKINVDGTQIHAEIDDTLLKTNETVLCSDSAGGWRSKIKTVNPVESDFQVEASELISRIEELKDNAEIWQATGGTHALPRKLRRARDRESRRSQHRRVLRRHRKAQ